MHKPDYSKDDAHPIAKLAGKYFGGKIPGFDFTDQITHRVDELIGYEKKAFREFVDNYHHANQFEDVETARKKNISSGSTTAPPGTINPDRYGNPPSQSSPGPSISNPGGQPGRGNPGEAGRPGGGNPNSGNDGGQHGGNQGATRSGDAGDGTRGGSSSSSSSSSGNGYGGGGRGGNSDGGGSGGNSGGGNHGGSSRPIVLDLDGDGVELVSLDESTAFYDSHGDGYQYNLGWAGSDDGLLAYDKDGDNDITARDEIAFVDYVEGAQTDLEGLRYFDSNTDGVLDARDAEFAKFKVWQDVDQDGEVDAGELRSLSTAGITSIALAYAAGDDGVAEERDGNTIFGEGEYTKADGTTGVFADAAFAVSEVGFCKNGNRCLVYQLPQRNQTQKPTAGIFGGLI